MRGYDFWCLTLTIHSFTHRNAYGIVSCSTLQVATTRLSHKMATVTNVRWTLLLQGHQGLQELEAGLANQVYVERLANLEPQVRPETPAIRDLHISDRLDLELAEVEVKQEIQDILEQPDLKVSLLCTRFIAKLHKKIKFIMLLIRIKSECMSKWVA